MDCDPRLYCPLGTASIKGNKRRCHDTLPPRFTETPSVPFPRLCEPQQCPNFGTLQFLPQAFWTTESLRVTDLRSELDDMVAVSAAWLESLISRRASTAAPLSMPPV